MAIKGKNGFLIQCKSSLNDGLALSWGAVKDVVAGEALYRKKHPNVNFSKIAATNQFFNMTAVAQADANGVSLFDRMQLLNTLEVHKITRVELEKFLM